MYIDNELSNAEKKAVEVFIEQNEDLKAEFDALLQSVIQPDLVEFENKEALIKDESYALAQQNLLLLLDNELTGVQKKNTEQLISNDIIIAKEWEILQQTKLSPDNSIVFENKKLLYKQEASVIVMYWKRIAAAAILLGFITWSGLRYYNNSEKADGMQLVNNNLPTQKTIILKNKNIDANSNAFAAAVNNTNSSKNNVITVAKKEINITKGRNLIAGNQRTLHLENINKAASNEIVTANVLPQTGELKLANNETPSIESSLIKASNAVENNNVYTTVYDEELNDDKIFYISEERIRRSKLGGFFRKAKRVFERTANIKTSEGIKIAGFEIAIK
jgi:hypothetical protein